MQLITVEVRLRETPEKKHRNQLRNIITAVNPIEGSIEINKHYRRKKSLVGSFRMNITKTVEMLDLMRELWVKARKGVDSCWTVELRNAGPELKDS